VYVCVRVHVHACVYVLVHGQANKLLMLSFSMHIGCLCKLVVMAWATKALKC